MIEQSRGFYRFIYYPLWLLFRILHPIWHISGRENIPPEPYLLVCNHSSASDPVLVCIAAHPDRLFRIMAKKELMDIPVLGWALGKLAAFPVDRKENGAAAMMNAMRVLKSGQSLLVFPEGTRVRVGQKSEPKAGAAALAARCKVPVVPMYLTQDKRLFRPIQVTFGEPYYIEPAARHMTEEEQQRFTKEMMEKCYALEVQNGN